METPNTILPLIGSLAGVLLTGMIGSDREAPQLVS